MTLSSSPRASSSRASSSTAPLSTAISDLEQALAALDKTVHAYRQPEITKAGALPSTRGDLIPVGQVRDELIALRELVSGAAQLIAQARAGGHTQAPNPQGAPLI